MATLRVEDTGHEVYAGGMVSVGRGWRTSFMITEDFRVLVIFATPDRTKISTHEAGHP